MPFSLSFVPGFTTTGTTASGAKQRRPSTLCGQLEKHWADFTDISFGEPNQALDEDRAALRKAADVLRAYAEALRS